MESWTLGPQRPRSRPTGYSTCKDCALHEHVKEEEEQGEPNQRREYGRPSCASVKISTLQQHLLIIFIPLDDSQQQSLVVMDTRHSMQELPKELLECILVKYAVFLMFKSPRKKFLYRVHILQL